MQKMIETILARKIFCPEITENTPICVLEELISDQFSLEGVDEDDPNYYQFLLDRLDEISLCEKHHSVKEVSLFLNPEVAPEQWKPEQLERAAQFLFRCSQNPDEIPFNFEMGYQTPSKLYRVNLFILYKFCRLHSIQTTVFTSKDELEKAVKLFRNFDDELLLKQFNRYLILGQRNLLVAAMAQSELPLPEIDFVTPAASLEEYPKQCCSLDDKKLEIFMGKVAESSQTFEPNNNLAAVILAALRYRLDLSYCADPLLEYHLLVENGIQGYIPNDSWMGHWRSKNPELFDLTCTFNPWFPKSFYYYERLGERLLERQKETIPERGKIYQRLLELEREDGIFCGIRPGVLNRETPIILADIEEFASCDILTYCAFRDSQKKLYAISKDELVDYLLQRNDFVTPFTADLIFSDKVLEKINHHLANEDVANKIEQTKAIVRSNNELLRSFKNKYLTAEVTQKEKVKNVLNKLVELSMYMRGWSGEGPYPIEVAITPTEFFESLLVNVTNSMNDLEELSQELDELNLLDLPLMSYRDNNYLISTNPLDGLTIRDRLTIVREGEDGKNEASCIRISSNWLAASAHRIMKQLDLKTPFPIEKLRYVL